MRKAVAIPAAILMSWTLVSATAPRWSWNKIRYHGGTVQVKVDPWDWNTTLVVSQDEIAMTFSPRVTVKIKPSQVRSISYGQEAKRRVEDVVALGVLVGPFALFGLLHVSRDELVGIVYDTDDGKRGAVLLQSPFAKQILDRLKDVTGKQIEINP